MKNFYCLFIVLVAAFLLVSCTATQANKTVVDIGFAKRISDLYRNDGEEGSGFALKTLDTLNRGELRKLKMIIENDIFNEAGVIITPPLPVEYRIIGGLRKHIDDRLGILDYNLVAEGRITGESSLPSTVSWYFFKPNCGREFEIYIGSAISPVENYDDIIDQDIRIFVRAYHPEGEQGKLLRAVQKIELLKDDPSVNTSPR